MTSLKRLLDYMLRHGVTTVEAKSGYGLDWETEKRQLDVVALDRDHQIDLVSTFMAAMRSHRVQGAVPKNI